MDYCEIEPPEALRHLVKAAWTLAVPEDGPEWVRHVATPDGCIEIIRRLAGRSRWGEEQPETFVAGIVTGPAELELGTGARFVALRVWPWTWNAIARPRSPALIDRWADLAEAAPGFAMPDDAASASTALPPLDLDPDSEAMARIVPAVARADELVERSGRSLRWLQRWFAREVGIPPRLYLRLLRFQETLAGLQQDGDTLAGHAAARGYADQAHMAREFRAIAGTPAGVARRKAVGPFI
jgi:AraC-like DNA-binding protein